MKGSRKKSHANGRSTFTMMLSPKDREALEKLAELAGKTRSGAARSAIHQQLWILQAQEERKPMAIIDEQGQAVHLHFVM